MPGFVPRLVVVAAAAGLLLTAETGVLAQDRVGVNSAVNPQATGVLPGAAPRRLVIGQDVIFNEHITTGEKGQTQLLFLDESSMSVGPNSDITIDQFVYDPKTGTGKLAMSATRGLLRYVGGKLSKQDNAVTLRTATATLAVRGGAFVGEIDRDGKTIAAFLYGKGLTVTGVTGGSETLIRPGFETIVLPGGGPSQPGPMPPGLLARYAQQLDGQSGSTGGAAVVPTDTAVANSGVEQTISGNLAQSVQQAAQSEAATQSFSTTTNPSPLPTTITSTVQSTVVQQGTASAPPPSSSPSGPQPVVIQVAGMVKSTPDPNTGLGFTDQSSGKRVPFSGGTITYPSSALQYGTASAFINDNNPGQAEVFPLTAGSTGYVIGQKTTGSDAGKTPAVGTAFTNADSSFFYADLLSTDTPGQNIFVFAGTPVSQSFFAGNLPQQVQTFRIRPDGALASGPQAQTIPFLPPAYGGTMPNAVVSPLYLATGANSPFGAANSTRNNFVSPKYLQASLAVNGNGANQTAALVVATGEFFTSGTGAVAAAGPVRGTVMQSATSPAVHISSGTASVPDGNGNTLFGGSNNTLEGFVLDQNSYNFTPNLSLQLASAGQFGAPTVNYAFNQPATSNGPPAAIPGTTQNLNESGYFGGIMTHTTNPTSGSPYVLSGVVSPLQSTVTNNRVAATFAGSDPFTPSQSGISSVVLQFGDVSPGTNASRGTYINNSIYAATDSPVSQSSINGNPLPLPQNGTTTTPSPSIAMVTSATVPNTSWFPAGVTPCACQFLQWGYWTGQVPSTTTSGFGTNRTDRAYINTWLAGMPTVTLPTSGVGTYNGAAVGTVFNGASGATYLAAGGFNGSYNFATQSGTMTLSNFDGHTITASGSAPLSGANYTFGVSPTASAPVAGVIRGSFFGPAAAETGGNFSVHTIAGPTYLASGIFAGKH